MPHRHPNTSSSFIVDAESIQVTATLLPRESLEYACAGVPVTIHLLRSTPAQIGFTSTRTVRESVRVQAAIERWNSDIRCSPAQQYTVVAHLAREEGPVPLGPLTPRAASHLSIRPMAPV